MSLIKTISVLDTYFCQTLLLLSNQKTKENQKKKKNQKKQKINIKHRFGKAWLWEMLISNIYKTFTKDLLARCLQKSRTSYTVLFVVNSTLTFLGIVTILYTLIFHTWFANFNNSLSDVPCKLRSCFYEFQKMFLSLSF